MLHLLFAAVLAQSAPSSAPASTVIVHIKNYAYAPATVTVRPGAIVRFINDDDDAHTVTSTTKAFDSGGLDTNEKWTHTFAKAGKFPYLCSLHPQMRGTIIVSKGSK